MTQRNTYFQDEVVTQDKIDVKNLKRLMRYVIPHKKVFFIVLALMLLTVVASLVPPLLLKNIVNVVIPNRDYARFAMLLGCFVIAGGTEILITFYQQKSMGKMGHGIIADLRHDIFYKLQALPFDYFDNRPAGKIVVRVTDYIGELADFFINYLMNFILNLVKIVVVTVFMLVQSWMLTLVVYSAVIPLTIGVFLIRKAIRKLFRYHRAKVSNRTAFIVESIMGEKIIQNYNRTKYNVQIYHDLQQDSAQTWMKIVRRNELNAPVSEFFWNMGILAIYAVSLALIGGGATAMAGTVIAFTLYTSICSEPLLQFTAILQQLSQVSANLERIYETVDTPVTIRDAENAVPLENVQGKVDFNDVTFGYEPGITVLEHFDLHVSPGEKIALVGPTGAGKTTVISLLTRFYDVGEGSVQVDGKDVRSLTLHTLRKEIGVLMQEPFIFKGSILDNIRYGTPEATDEECIAAAKTIYCDRVAARFPDGYHALLGERGEGLSAGEKQLISFARIVLKNPRIVILDEATSAIDSETELLIQAALDRILAGKTSFIVAHRLSTIRKADRILFIADKGIAEQGTHEELMRLKGRYYALNQRK